jgi:hypothetical protein
MAVFGDPALMYLETFEGMGKEFQISVHFGMGEVSEGGALKDF